MKMKDAFTAHLTPPPFDYVVHAAVVLVAPGMKRRTRSAAPSSPRAMPSTRSPAPSHSSATTDQKVSWSVGSLGALKSLGGVPDGCCAGEAGTGANLSVGMIACDAAGVNAVQARQDQCSGTRARWLLFGQLDPKAQELWARGGAGSATVGGRHQ